MGVVHQSRGVLAPASEHLRSEPAIVAGMAQATLGGTHDASDWHGLVADYDRIREHIEHVVPGFAQYNRRVREPAASICRTARAKGSSRRRRAKRSSPSIPSREHDLATGELLLTTIRSHDQFNTTIYGENDRYRGISDGRRVVFLNARGHRRSAGCTSGRLGRPGQPLRQRATPRRALQGRPLRDPARAAPRPITRRPTCSCRCGASPTQQSAGVEVDPDPDRSPRPGVQCASVT